MSAQTGIDHAAVEYEKAVFVSYAWGGESERTIDELERAFAERGIRIVRDKKDLDYKGSIETFEQRIGQGQCIILVISDKYLRSEHCMYELVEIDENRDLRERIFPIVLSDASIFKALDRLAYIKHWDEQIEQLEQSIKQLETMANLTGITADLDKFARIRANLDHLTDLLGDLNTLTPEIHQASGFSTLISAVEKVLKEKETEGLPGKGSSQKDEALAPLPPTGETTAPSDFNRAAGASRSAAATGALVPGLGAFWSAQQTRWKGNKKLQYSGVALALFLYLGSLGWIHQGTIFPPPDTATPSPTTPVTFTPPPTEAPVAPPATPIYDIDPGIQPEVTKAAAMGANLGQALGPSEQLEINGLSCTRQLFEHSAVYRCDDKGSRTVTYHVYGEVYKREGIPFLVKANKTWQDTGLYIKVGQTVEITYFDGLWCATGSNMVDANGQKDIVDNSILEFKYLVDKEHLGALVGRIGSDSDSLGFRVGRSVKFTAEDSGKLYLAMNDNPKNPDLNLTDPDPIDYNLDDNKGIIAVQIIVK